MNKREEELWIKDANGSICYVCHMVDGIDEEDGETCEGVQPILDISRF